MSTIIKAADAQVFPSGLEVRHAAYHFSDMETQAENYLQDVRRRVQQIVDEAHRHADAIRKQAEQEGRQAALAAVRDVLDRRVTAQMETLLPALRECIDAVHHARQTWMNHWERSAVRVATAIARKVIRRELSRQPDIAGDLVRETLELAGGNGEITLRLNPTDHENLGQQIEAWTAELARLAPTHIVADPEISLGGCRLETCFGSIDQQVETQLQRIEEELT
jgi:flagellar assembly protein FliH